VFISWVGGAVETKGKKKWNQNQGKVLSQCARSSFKTVTSRKAAGSVPDEAIALSN
jgi:hypothetical protein